MWHPSLFVISVLSSFCSNVLSELIGPGNQYVVEGNKLTFSCKTDDSGASLKILFTDKDYNDLSIDKTVKSSDGSYNVITGTIDNLNIAKHDKSRVECDTGDEAHQFTIFVIPKNDIPEILESTVMEKRMVEVGKEFTLNCTEVKLPDNTNPVFIWYVGNCLLKEETPGGKTSLYTVEKVARNDGGIYTCKVEHPDWRNVEAISAHKYYQVNVTLAKTKTVEKDEEVVAVEGKRADLDCAIAGFPTDIIWEKDGKEIGVHKAILNVTDLPPTCEPEKMGDGYLVSSDGKTLTIPEVDSSHRGQYLCVGKSDKITITHSFILRVRDPLGALWPFIGILIEAIVLAFVIILSEKLRRDKEEKSPKAEFSTTSSDGSKGEKVRLSAD